MVSTTTLLRRRRWLAALALVAPGVTLLTVDIARRASFIGALRGRELALYGVTSLGAVLFWAVLLHAAAVRRGPFRRAGAFLFVVLFAFALSVQHAFFTRYKVYVSVEPLIWGDSWLLGAVAALPLWRSQLLPLLGLGLASALAFVWLARRSLRPTRSRRKKVVLLSAFALLVIFAAPVSPPVPRQAAAPEVLYLHGIAVFVNDKLKRQLRDVKPLLVRVQRRSPVRVPPLSASPPARRNLIVLLQEAQRADVTCIGYDPDCQLATRATNLLAPARLPFFQARAAGSSTALAVAVLWSGIDATETRERLHSTPLIWEYARAAGWDTAYWTSQNLMFGNARLWVQDLPLSCAATGTEIDPHCDTLTGASDEALVDRVLADLPKLVEPFFAVVHFSNIHRPRVMDPKRAPFQPTHIDDHGPGGPLRQNHYKNSVYLSDLAVARLIERLRATEVGKRSVLFYTSDHGEAYGEHRNENDHSSSVFDEEIRVPLWIDAPPGVLSAAELAGYRSNRDALVSQYDQAATLLDLIGIWDSPALVPFKRGMLGTPIARPLAARPVPLTNVSWVWEYHRPNWGMMLGPRKVLAQIEDPNYLCFDVLADPGETHDLGPAACAELVAEADRTFGMLPKDMRRLRDRPDFGRAGGR